MNSVEFHSFDSLPDNEDDDEDIYAEPPHSDEFRRRRLYRQDEFREQSLNRSDEIFLISPKNMHESQEYLQAPISEFETVL